MTRSQKTDRQRYADAVWRQGEAARRAQRERLLATETPNPRAITLALDACALYGPEVDRALGGEEPMVDEWEAGTRRPTGDQVRALSELTGYAVEFFYREHPELDGPMFMCSGPGGCHVRMP